MADRTDEDKGVKDISGQPEDSGIKKVKVGKSPVLRNDRGFSRKHYIRRNADKDFIVVSFFTPNYIELARRLIRSLKKFDLPYDIEEIRNKGSWLLNTAYKAEFIKRKLEQYEKIAWLDCDAVVMEYPKYFDVIEEDIAVYYENFKTLISGTMMFRRSIATAKIVERWVRNCYVEPRMFEQKHLQFAIQGSYMEAHEVSIFFLPDSYVCMDGITKGKAVIRQTQAHRLHTHWRR